MKAVMVRFADDFVILCRKGQGAEMKRRLESWLERRKLRLNEKKTRIVDFDHESPWVSASVEESAKREILSALRTQRQELQQTARSHTGTNRP